jgi:hypothetical protein
MQTVSVTVDHHQSQSAALARLLQHSAQTRSREGYAHSWWRNSLNNRDFCVLRGMHFCE